MRINKMTDIVKAQGWLHWKYMFYFTRYVYSGHDGRRVYDWTLNIGPIQIVRHKIGN